MILETRLIEMSNVLHQGFSSHPDRSSTDDSARLTAARRWLEDFDSGRWLITDNMARETVDLTPPSEEWLRQR